MKYLIAFILTGLVSFAASLFFPWWIIAVVAFLVAFIIPMRPGIAALAAFLALFLLWGAQALYIDSANEHLLSARVSAILQTGSSFMLIVITAFVGGLVAGMSALTASLLRRLVFNRHEVVVN